MPTQSAGGKTRSTHQLWRDVAETQPDLVARLALRMRSPHARDALALAASDGTLDDTDLLALASSATVPATVLSARSGRGLAALALTWAGMQRSQDEVAAAAAAYTCIWDTVGGARLGAHHHRMAAQSLYLSGQTDTLSRLLPQLSKLADEARMFLETDLTNPFRSGIADGRTDEGEASHQHWVKLLSRPFTREGLEPIDVVPAGGTAGSHPFDRLACPSAEANTERGPLVSVVMPCYQPDDGLVTSVASILNQRYGTFEILMVDDASGPGYRELFERAASLDERITLIRLEANGGPYLARNEAMSRARGELITFQDADDWSHPSRLSEQVGAMALSPEAPACHTRAVRAHDDLTHQWLGYPAMRLHASSLMLRRSVYARLGPFLSVRKGGDSEYAERIESEVGPIPTIDKPLAVYRLRSGSLSRADFTFQWTSPDRLAFVGVYRAALRSGRSAPLPAPLTFAAGPVPDPRTTDRLDVAYLGDLSRDPESDPALVASMALTGEADHTSAELDHPPAPSPRRGLWHLEAPWTPSVKRRPMHPGWYDRVLANRDWQVVTRVEPVHVKRLVVLDPSVLLFCDALACMVGADHVQVASPTTGTFDRDIAAPAVDRDEVQAVVRRWFGVDPEWV